MNEYALDDEGTTGYFLPEDSQRLLTQVCNHVRFLARLGQPRGAEGTQEPATEVSRGEWMFCLEQLAEQLDLVLQEVSWPAQRRTTQKASEAAQDATEVPQDAVGASEADDADPPAQAESDPFVFGVTMEQLDQLNLLVERITAYGDAVSAEDMADFAPGTLSVLGHTIFDRANELDEIVTEINAQPLEQGAHQRFSVKETAPAYCIQASSEVDQAPRAVPALASPLQAYSPRPGGLHLH